jgi:exopolyphosphatase/guanosine-5'-triphosphate,3'-diphosphate pyrophosphatase
LTASGGAGKVAPLSRGESMMGGTRTNRSDEGGLFDKPLFDDPSARALSRVGVIDVGSNSVRFVVFDGAARSPAYFYNEKVMAGLGTGLAETGKLHPEGRKRAFAALRRFAAVSKAMKVSPLLAVATAAVREAKDGADFRAQAARETGLSLRVIEGEEEARLAAQGVLLGWPEAEGVICDIGGSSMELAEVKGGKVGRRLSTPLGPLKLERIKGGPEAIRKHARGILEEAAKKIGRPKRIYLVGGSWRAIARIDIARRAYPLTVLHEYRMTTEQVRLTATYIEGQTTEMLRARTGIGAERMALVPIAVQVLRELVAVLKPEEIYTSGYGIREGLLYEAMPEALRARDPLIEACRWAEANAARVPGFGKKLFAFVAPLFPGAPPERLRIMKAACLLHDVSWRAHPDYRHEVCFDNATRANLGGLNHEERVFLGLALLHRYRNSRAGTRFEPLFQLLTDRAMQEAEVLGKAMRFGAMFSAEALEETAALRYDPKRRVLELVLSPEAEPLYGEVAAARFEALAKALGVEKSAVRISAKL